MVGTPISEDTAKQVRDYLETVITGENGTGHNYAIEGYPVAGKTVLRKFREKAATYRVQVTISIPFLEWRQRMIQS